MRSIPRATLLCATFLAVAPLHAQEWTHELAPYVWAAGMDGTAGVRGVNADVDASFGDILDNLETGFMGMYRGTRDRFSITVDGVYMGLGATGRGPGDFVKADLDMDQAALEVDVGYELVERFTVFAGVRYNDLSVDVEATGPLGESRSVDGSESWVDPVVGAHYSIPFSETWSANLRGDIGGFGVGSDFAWQGIATLRWQSSPGFGVLAAYRYMAMDYESGKGTDAFKYDMSMSGPALGVVFTF
jgi:outer membrane receptor protein involved in Fe transport